MNQRNLSIIIFISAVIGIGVAGYSLAHHQAFVSGAFCSVNDSFNCDIVNRGPYSELFGIPIALIGVIGYVLLGAGALLQFRSPTDRSLSLVVLGLAAGGFLFSGYLTGIEAFVLKTWCLLCLTSQTLMAVMLGSSGAVWMLNKPSKKLVPEISQQ
ncbi:MAG: vitamin K epoxide reductase family protein [bacterium]|nr:vitamin K epoxide reductase family protein [bacterium]